jgi:hypothetical protein
MLPLFCLRLAAGMLAALLFLNPTPINPRFFRTHFLTALGLGSLALVILVASGDGVPWPLGVALGLAALGSMAWSIEGTPGGRVLIVLTAVAFGATLNYGSQPTVWKIADDVSTSALLGVSITAMLMGHSYLIAPQMSLSPLWRLLIGLYVSLFAKAVVAGLSLWMWTAAPTRSSVQVEALLWLPVRWGLGLLVPAVLGAMAWQTTKLRNTQSSTGILYIVTVFVFLGELMAQLLLNVTGYHL